MHLGVLTSSWPRHPADHAGNFVAHLAAGLARRGHTLEVWAPWDGQSPRREFVDHIQVRRFRVAPPGLRDPLFYGAGAPENLAARPRARVAAPLAGAAFLAAAARRARRWDGLLSHWLVPAGLAGALVRRGGGPRHVAVLHGGGVDLVTRHALARRAVRAVRSGFDRLLVVSRSVAARAAALFGAPRQALPLELLPLPGAPVASVAPRLDRVAARRRLGLDPRRPVALFLGRIVPLKGPGLLLAAAARLPALQTVVAGPGDGAFLVAAARQLGVDLHLVGPADATRREWLLAAADLLVVPSLSLPGGRAEGLPQVAREAAARGCPVVAAATGGLPELAAEAALRLFPPGDPAALAQALREVLADLPRWQERARRRAGAGGDWDRAAATVEGAFRVA